jgi:hypothetical protein
LTVLPNLLGILALGCGPSAPSAPTAPVAVGAFQTAVGADPSCTLALHAVLREAASTAVIGQIQFRIKPPQAGSTDAVVQYRGVYNPTNGYTYALLSAELVPRIPDQGPTWKDVSKGDPDAPLTAVLGFLRTAVMSPELAAALADDPTRYKAVVNVRGTTGGRSAEGTVEPTTDVPESLRERQRSCFATG